MNDFLSDNLQYIIEAGITLLVIGLQINYYNKSKRQIKEFKNIFPPTPLNNSNVELQDDNPQLFQRIKIDKRSYSNIFTEIVGSINNYLEKNHGAIDFAILKDIVERRTESEDEDASSGISLPLYIGLMGTFIGIVIGLVKIAFFGGVTSSNINAFLGGVFIAMIASFAGLLFTVINSSKNYNIAKKENGSRKNIFLKFLENELLPYSGSSISAVLERFKNNIGDFNKKFEINISLFDEKFSGNINSLKESVNKFIENIDPVIENTNDQKELLKELKSVGFKKIVEANLNLFKKMDESVPNFLLFIEKQKELNSAIDKTLQLVSLIDNVLNRVKTFEESINNLGERISTAEYLGLDLLKMVKEKLDLLNNQFELLKQHSQLTSGQIEHHFSQEKEKITLLSLQVLSELQEALNFNVEKNPLKKLELLEPIETLLKEWRQNIITVNEFSSTRADINSSRLYIKEIQEEVKNLVKLKENQKIVFVNNEKHPGTGNDEQKEKPRKSFLRKIFSFRKNRNGK